MSTFNKGTLDAYRKIVTKEIVTRTMVATGSVNVGGNLYVTGSITASGGGLGTGDMSKAVYDVSNSGSVDNSSKLDGLDLAEVRTHAPASHSGSHSSGSGDAISIFKSQVRDIDNFTLTAPQLTITGSSTSSINGNLIVTGSISGSYYEGPVMNIRTGSVYTFSRRRLNVVSGGAMIINMSEDPVNDEVVLTLQSTGSGGAGTGLADTVTSGMVYGTLSGSGTATSASRSDHQHGTPSLGLDNAQDVGSSASSGSIATGSKVDHVHRGVLSVAASGSSDLYTRVYITGSTGITLTQSGQILTFATDVNNLTSANITASALLSGSDIHAPIASINALTSIGVTATTISGSTVSGSLYIGDSSTITNIVATSITGSIISGSTSYSKDLTSTNINVTNITGSTISGSLFNGPLVKVTNVVATNITGSSILSGANIYSSTATITNVNVVNLTGSVLSGSNIYGSSVNVTSLTATNITGSTVSGSNFVGPTGTVTNLYVTNLTGSGVISGSTIYASTLQVPNFSPTGILATTITGSSTISGSTVYATTFSGSSIKTIGDISGSSFSGAVVSVRTGSDTTTYARKRLNFINAGGIICNVQDDPSNSEIQVQLQASAGGITPSDSVVSSNVSGQSTNAGTSITLSRGDHVHGTPSLSASNAQDVGLTAAAGTINTGSRVDHVHKGVSSLAYSGSTAIYGNINVTGSANVTISQGTQTLTVSLPTSITLTNVTGSTLISGSTLRGASATITNVNATNVTGSLISGSDHRGPTATITSINATSITGSTLISGSLVYGSSATITSINCTNITGSFVSGSVLYANTATIQSAIIPNLTLTNVTGSTSVSGSNIYGANAVITNINTTNITGSNISGSSIRSPTAIITNIIATNVTGSLLSGSDFRGPTATITNHYGTNVSGSGTVSGSILRGSDITGSHLGIAGNVVVTGNLSGSSISGSITMNMDGNARVALRQNSGGSGYLRRRINLIEGTGISLNVGDDAVNEEVDVTITSTATASALSGSMGAYKVIVFSGSMTGGPYFVKDENGTLINSGSSLSTIVNSATTGSGGLTINRTWIETVYLKGNLKLDNSFIVPNFTRLYLDGDVTLNNNVNKSMIVNANPLTYNHSIFIEGGVWDGNSSNQNAGFGFSFQQSGSDDTDPREIIIKDIIIINSYDHALRIDCRSGVSIIPYISNCYLRSSHGNSIYGYGFTDFVIHGNWFGADEASVPAISLTGCGTGVFSDFKTDGAISLVSTRSISFGNFEVDTYNRNMDGLSLYGCQNNSFANAELRASSNSGYTGNAAIRLGGDSYNVCQYNVFSNIYCGRPFPYTDTQRWANTVIEGDIYSDYNLYSNISGQDALAGMTLQSHSKQSNCLP